MPHSRSKRVLLYSHDSFGLGHVSRCRTIANALVAADTVLMVDFQNARDPRGVVAR